MTSTAREQIASLLAGIGAGSFASRRTAPADDLVLAVAGVGPLHFPIQRDQAQILLRKARPARYGRREQTLLDRRVRDTGEIPAGRVKIDRRCWNRTLRPMLDALGSDLGLAPGQRFGAELHSFLIYGPGQFFKQHQDSERKEEMVGTLVVTLPSRFTGGAIVIEHHGERVTYRATTQPLSFIAFYADCRHEVRPVRTGYRIVLTYDLLLQGEATGAVTLAPAVVDGLASQLREHFTTPLPASPYVPRNAPPREPPSRLVYLLDHEYTQRGLGWGRLKGHDVHRAAALRAASERTDCELALGLATMHETRECEEPWEPPWHERRRWQRDEDDDWLTEDEPLADDPDAYLVGELIDSSVTLERWIDPRGGASAPILTAVEAHEICASTPSSALTPYAAEYEGYMGNYGNTMDRWYRRAAIVLWPRERSFAVRAEASPRWALEALVARLRAGELQESRKLAASLLPFWSEVVARADRPALFAQVLQVAAALESQDLAAALLRPFHLTVVTPRAARYFAALLDRYGEEWGRLLLGGWARPEWGMRAGSRDVLAWLTALRALCAGCSAARCPGGATAARLLVKEGWGALQGEIAGRRILLPPSQRERALVALARPILGWLGGAAIVEEDTARASPTGAMRCEGPIARAIGYLCGDENTVLVPCLMHLLRVAAKSVKSERRVTLGLDAIGRFCAVEIAARLATAPRQPDDWSIGLPSGCDCALCHRLGTFLSDPAQRQLEWPLAKAGRQHVHQRIDQHELPVRHQTRRSGSPYTLVLEKTKTLFAREVAARHAWQVDLNWLSGAGWTAPASGAHR
ncbi:MAG TPA: 2OG-Fe(II) oxygenase [Thermoanaerobaculia bacterium]|nr:2OG-Fe(II) oxygenase [Thermoanaerobaculia bacterium]